MDRAVKAVATTAFAGLVDTKHIYAVYRYFDREPDRTLFAMKDDGTVLVDFDYGTFRASECLGLQARELDMGECRTHAALVARELAEVDAIDADVVAYVRRGVARLFLRRLEQARRSPRRVEDMERACRRMQRTRADPEFVRDALWP
uniref:Uncharacterized protein n=1 Tax=Rousettus bat poxvirus TaxID=3141933 RepID=A0AAU7E2G6_9POXV